MTLYETSIKGCQDETRNRLEKCIKNLKAIFNLGSLKGMPFERLGSVTWNQRLTKRMTGQETLLFTEEILPSQMRAENYYLGHFKCSNSNFWE